MHTRLITVSAFVIMLVGCDAYEKRRLQQRMNDELGALVESTPNILDYGDYGSIEEGGDFALFQLRKSDCDNVRSNIGELEATQPQSRYHIIFAQNGIAIGPVHTKYMIGGDGTSVQYVLDSQSCTLYRQFHYE